MSKTKSTPEVTSQQGSNEGGGERSIERRNPYGLSQSAWSPFSFMRRFSEEMDRIFEDFGYGRSWPSLWSSSFGGSLTPRSEFGRTIWSPQIEMFERGNQLVVRADLPGLKKDDIKLEVADNCLTVEGERRYEQEEKQEGRYHSERSYGRFYRCIDLPKGVDPGRVNATFRDGVLEVTMPKPPGESPGGRRIEIQESAASKTSEKK
jgi:HSP20 family protein